MYFKTKFIENRYRMGDSYQSPNYYFMNLPTKPIILFDGVCNLCNSSVQFIIKRDSQAHFLFASLQSEIGQAILREFGLNTSDFDTFVLIENGKAYTKSTAALKVVKKLEGAWKYFYIFNVIPTVIRDLFYIFVAKNRYRFFGKKEYCMLPQPELKSRFIA